MSISTAVVTVTISLGTGAAQAASLTEPAIFCDAPYVGGRTYELSTEGLAEMITDGFTVNDRGYLMASVMKAQEPRADSVLVYARSALTTSVVDFTPKVTTEGAVYSFDLQYANISSTIEYTVQNGDDVDKICDAIESLVDASAAGIAGAAVAPDNSTATKLVFTGGTAGEPVIFKRINPAMITLLDVSTDGGIATDLAAAALDSSFDGFVIDSFAEAENNAAAVWAEANERLFLAQSGDTTNLGDAAGTGVATDFKTANYGRSVVATNDAGMSDVGVAALARQFGFNPGLSSAAFQELNGVEAGAVRSSRISTAQSKNVLLYALNGGNPHTWFGKLANGRSIRVQQVLDLLKVRIKEAVLTVFLSNEFVPMSTGGFARQEAAVRGVLSGFAAQGLIIPAGEDGGFTVTVPNVADVSDSDLSAGKLPNLRFSCAVLNDMLSVAVSGSIAFS